MHLFKTEMLRVHPPQRRTYGIGPHRQRSRFGCRNASPPARTLTVAIRQVLAPPASAAAISHDSDHAAKAA
jgi:hypothetical protein